MGFQKLLTINFLCIFIMEVFSKNCQPLEYCDHNPIKQRILSDFINDIISTMFSDCFVIQIEQELETQRFYSSRVRTTPTILMTIPKSGAFTQNFFVKDDNLFTRLGKQCLIYEVVLNGLEINPNLPLIFTNKESQKRAKNSYIFINEYENFEAAKALLVHPDLKNYERRIWVDIVPPDFNAPDETLLEENNHFAIYFFCFYCYNGSPGIGYLEKTYQHDHEIPIDELFPDVTSNLNGHTMRVTAPPAPPLVLITPSKTNPKENVIHGQQANILYSIAHKYNFTCSLYSAPGGTTGSRLPNGSWNGVMGEILYGRADIGLCVATAYERRDVADFTVSVFYAFLVLVSTKPIPVFEWQAIFYPFKVTAWFALIASTILTLYLYQFLHNHSLELEVPWRKKWQSKLFLMRQIKKEIISNFKAFYMTVGTLLEQGVPVDYNTMPSRMIATFWMFFAIIITCAYRSKLFSFLISPTIETPPSSFEELAISDYTWGMKSLGGIALLFITQSPLLYIRNIGQQMEIYTDKYSCLDKTFDGKFTCIIYKAYIDYMMEVRYWKLKHQFYISDFVTPPVGSAWALAKYSPMQKHFDEMSFRIYEMGLADKYLVDYQVSFAKIARALAQASNSTSDTFGLNANFKNDDDTGPKPLQMGNLYGGFFILGFGICISAAVLLGEKVKYDKFLIHQKKIWTIMRVRLKTLKWRKGNKKVSFEQVVKIILPNVLYMQNIRSRTESGNCCANPLQIQSQGVEQV